MHRRHFISATACMAAGAYVRGVHAAGSLNVGFWDHFVPGANEVLRNLAQEWARKERVDLRIDLVPSLANKNTMTIAMEAQAKVGHDILAFPNWFASAHAAHLEPVDDVMRPLIAQYGALAPVAEYLGKHEGSWIAVPATVGALMYAPCARTDLFKKHAGLDLTQMYPANGLPEKSQAGEWTWDRLLVAAEKLFKAGAPVGIGFGQTADSVATAGAIFAAHGAFLVNAKGEITANTDATRRALEYCKNLSRFLPPDVFAWDDASNNRWLISGKGSLILNPPSAWAVAKRDNPRLAEQLWTFPSPKGPNGRYMACNQSFWGIWKFSKNKAAARSLLAHLSQREAVEKLVSASEGYDIPPFFSMRDFNIWAQIGPPKGTLANYVPRQDQIISIAHAPAPPPVAMQMANQALLTRMTAKYAQGNEPIEKVTGWAESEIEGYLRR